MIGTIAAKSEPAPPCISEAAIRNVASYIRLPLLFNHWYAAALSPEIGRKPIARTLLDRSIVLFRKDSGAVVALQNRCLHRSFPLSESRLEGDQLVCGYHGARYSSDGRLVGVPCQKNVPDRALRSYPVREIGPFVFIWMGDAEPDKLQLGAIDFLDDESFRTVHGSFEIACSYLMMQENLNDFTHFAFLHHDSFGVPEQFAEVAPTITRRDGKVFSKRAEHDSRTVLAVLTPPGFGASLVGKTLTRYDESHSVAPGIFVSRLWTEVEGKEPPGDGLKAYILHLMTPVTKDRCRYWWAVAFNFGQDEDDYFEALPAFLLGGFREDAAACEAMQRLLDEDQTAFDEMNIAGDRAGLLFRKIMLDWANDEYATN